MEMVIFLITHFLFFFNLKASGQTLKVRKLNVKGKKTESKKGKKVTLTGDTEDEDSASTSSSLKRGIKDLKKRKMEENTSINLSKQESFTSVKKPKRDDSKDLALCRYYFCFHLLYIDNISFYLFRNVLSYYR